MSATATFTTDQAVIVRIPGGRTREGVYVGTTDAGKITVRYSNAAGEKTADFKAVDVRPADVEEQPAPVDEVPVVDVNEDDARTEWMAEAEEPQGPHTQEQCEDLDGCTDEHLPSVPVRDDAPAARKSSKGFMPEGWVTPVGLTKVINDRGLYPGEGQLGGIYNPIAASEKAGLPFPGLYDHEGYKVIVEVEAGVRWYVAWTERQAARHANAAERRERPTLTDEERAARSAARTAARTLRDAEARLTRAEEAAKKANDRLEVARREVEAARKAVAETAQDDADAPAEEVAAEETTEA